MNEIELTLDVFCPTWTVTPFAYRIYVDSDLLTERTYIWRNTEQYVKEHIIVNLEQGTHELKVLPIGNFKFPVFICKNFTVNKEPAELVNNQFVI